MQHEFLNLDFFYCIDCLLCHNRAKLNNKLLLLIKYIQVKYCLPS